MVFVRFLPLEEMFEKQSNRSGQSFQVLGCSHEKEMFANMLNSPTSTNAGANRKA
jgi:hypothetical protein